MRLTHVKEWTMEQALEYVICFMGMRLKGPCLYWVNTVTWIYGLKTLYFPTYNYCDWILSPEWPEKGFPVHFQPEILHLLGSGRDSACFMSCHLYSGGKAIVKSLIYGNNVSDRKRFRIYWTINHISTKSRSRFTDSSVLGSLHE